MQKALPPREPQNSLPVNLQLLPGADHRISQWKTQIHCSLRTAICLPTWRDWHILQLTPSITGKISKCWHLASNFTLKGHWCQLLQSAIAWTYRGIFTEESLRPSVTISNCLDLSNNTVQRWALWQLESISNSWDLARSFLRGAFRDQAPQSIAPCEPPATSHGHNQAPALTFSHLFQAPRDLFAMDFFNGWLMWKTEWYHLLNFYWT